jgi:23S rRNA pseudouridine1911/1915/1917 synthase
MRKAAATMAAAAWTRRIGHLPCSSTAGLARPGVAPVSDAVRGGRGGGIRRSPPTAGPPPPPPRPRAASTTAVDAGALTPGAFDPAVGGTLRVGLADAAPAAAGEAAAAAPTTTKLPRLRLDAFLAARCPSVSRARLAAAIRAGAVSVNGSPASRPGAPLKVGDTLIVAPLPPPPPLAAAPEELPSLVIVHEDDALIVVNKAPGVVVHPAPGARTGTLVGGLLHHVQKEAQRAQQEQESASGGGDGGRAGASPLPALDAGADLSGSELDEDEEEDEDDDDDGDGDKPRGFARPISLLDAAAAVTPSTSSSSSTPAALRPGIVHRLDRGTSGLLVVAKTASAHEALARDFAARAVRRVYVSLTLGVPDPPGGTVRTNVGRDPADRTRMAALPFGGNKGRPAVSDYRVVEVLAGGAAAVVEWRLRTGRTHQIRVHARHIGHPLVGDATYGGGGSGAVGSLAARAVGRTGAGRRGGGAALAAARAQAASALAALGGGGEGGGDDSAGTGGVRPALHARSLGFTHPTSGEALDFEVGPPPDFEAAADALRGLGSVEE